MGALTSVLKPLSKWGQLGGDERRHTCLAIIDFFSKEPTSVGDTADLAVALASSGEHWSWPEGIFPVADVPSTGGPGSLTTLVCPYLLAGSGCRVPKLSVLGSVAGAADVIQIVPGVTCELDRGAAMKTMKTAGISHTISRSRLAPADGFLFGVRAEVGKKSVPALVIASLLSKKLAVSCTAGAVDVRCRRAGNFGNDHDSCTRNAELLVEVARRLGLKVSCVVTDVEQPAIPYLGRGESLNCLHRMLSATGTGKLTPWLRDHFETCVELTGEALLAAGVASQMDQARAMARAAGFSGTAKNAFCAHLLAQGAVEEGLDNSLDAYRSCPRVAVASRCNGYIGSIDMDTLAKFLKDHNGRGGDHIGVELLRRNGDLVEEGHPLARLRTRAELPPEVLAHAIQEIQYSYRVGNQVPSDRVPELVRTIRA